MRRIVILGMALALALMAMPLRAAPAEAAAGPFQSLADRIYVEQTGHHLQGEFLRFWWTHGGVDRFGFPLTEEFARHGLTVQYFERARFEFHPDNPAPFRVLLGHLGTELTQGREEPAFRPLAGLSAQNTPDRRYFPQTGHFLSHGFKAYWEAYGGLELFGYPISEEFVEGGHTVQYFERARFEYHPEHAGTPYEVQLGLLGTQLAERDHAPMGRVARAQGVAVWPAVTHSPAKWIEIDLSLPQRLIAWEGDTAVYSTPVSGGTAQNPTPTGTFSIQWKVRSELMTGGTPGVDYYYLPDVPHVMYFAAGGYAIHGAYWHANWGYPISHGCVNLPLPAAEWLYNWAPTGTPVWIHGDPFTYR